MDRIDYPALVARALRGVVRDALSQAARDGLPGEHHFYIAFRTQAEGVVVPRRLTTQYPDEMTIVLQNQFWDLVAEEEAFEVTLRFGGALERLRIPYTALTTFIDPSVPFGLDLSAFGGGRPDGSPPPGGGEEAEAEPAADAPGAEPPAFPGGGEVVPFRRR